MEAKHIEVFNIKDNDIVIIRTEYPLINKERKRVEDEWTDIFKEQGFNNIKVIVLSGIKVEVLSRQVEDDKDKRNM